MIKSIIQILLTINFSCLLLVSCFFNVNTTQKGEIETQSDKIWNYSQSHPDGFTLDIRTMTEPTEGIAVSYLATQGCHSRKKLNRVVRHALHHDGYVGGWLDITDSLYYFDSTRLFPEDSLDAAIKFGLENKQKAIYSIAEKREIRLK
ncbi:MAG: hypothetical protein IKJ56_01755 [Bacteroidales bacterium]|nr:hypothetical protein [Bacteroidales bacterium]